MDTIITVCNKNISIRFLPHAIRILNDDELTNLLAHKTETSTNELVAAIHDKYRNLFNTNFAVSNSSIAVEIWGHVYVEKMANWIKSVSSLSFINKITDKIIYHCEMIDIGERGHDNNRFVWDTLAVFKKIIVLILPRK